MDNAEQNRAEDNLARVKINPVPISNSGILKMETYDPSEMDEELPDFTNGKEYPIFEEKMAGIYHTLYCTINDKEERVWVNGAFFHLVGKLSPQTWEEDLCKDKSGYPVFVEQNRQQYHLATCNIREEYKKLPRHMDILEFMSMVPDWRKMAEVPPRFNLKQIKALQLQLADIAAIAQHLKESIEHMIPETFE